MIKLTEKRVCLLNKSIILTLLSALMLLWGAGCGNQSVPSPSASMSIITPSAEPPAQNPLPTDIQNSDKPASLMPDVYSFGIVEVSLPHKPVHELVDMHFLGDDIVNDPTWKGWEGTLDIYKCSDDEFNLEIYVLVESVSDETVKEYIEPIIKGAYGNPTERLHCLEGQAGHFTEHAIESLGLNPLLQLMEGATESGGRVVSVNVGNGVTEERQEGYSYLADGRKIVSRGGQLGNLSVSVHVIASDSEGYEEGLKILDSMRAIDDDVCFYLRE